MKKILTLLAALIVTGSMMVVHADYFVAGTMNGWNAGDDAYKMSGSGPYSLTKQLSSGEYKFKITNGSWSQSWASFDNDASNVSLSESDGNIKFTLSTTSDVTFYFNASTSKAYVQAVAVSVPSYTFPAGTTIYYDATAYGQGIDDKDGVWHSNTSAIFSITLSDAWEVTATTKLFRSGPNDNWGDRTCSTLPEEGLNMIVVNADGINCQWGTYSGGMPEPNYETIYFVNVPEWTTPRLHLWGGTGASVTWPGVEMTLESETVNGYELYSYTALEGAYTNCIFSNNGSNQSADLDWSAGKYYYNGTWYDDIASIPSAPIVVTYETIYFVNVPEWTTPRVHLWGGTEGATSWPGAEMTLESETVNGYELYSYTAAEGAYASCIFSNNGSSQTADLTWSAGKYYYSGTWYDDIASIPSGPVVVNYETIYFVNGADWTTPRVYLWGGTEGATSWPGVEMTLESETVNGHELYSYTAAEGAYASCIFSDEGNNQSADLTWSAGKYYYSGTWYDDIASIPAESVPTYTVAGVEAVFGTNWDPTDATNDMTLNAGVYEWSKENITLPVGNVTFKVVKDHNYAYGEWPSSNYELAIPVAGIYTISITFTPATEEVAATATKTGDAEVENTAALTGEWDSWAIENMSLSAGKESASITKHFDAGSYEFKIVVNSSDYRSNGHWFHRDEWTEADGITSEGEKMSFTADIDGDYTFTWTFATNKIEITFPALTWTEIRSGLAAERYYTVCWPKEMLYVRGASVWSFAGKDASMAYLVKEEGALDAGKPYIIYAEGAKFEAVLVGDDAAASSNNGLYGTLSNMTNADLLAAGATYMLKDNQLRPVGGGHLDANRAYVILDNITGGKPAGMPAHKVRGIPMQRDEATGIEDVQGDNVQCTKMMINGQLFIIRGENMFDATGRLVK